MIKISKRKKERDDYSDNVNAPIYAIPQEFSEYQGISLFFYCKPVCLCRAFSQFRSL